MNTMELQHKLELLRAELNRTAGMDNESRRQLHALIAEIERNTTDHGQDAETTPAAPSSFQERIAAAMTDFEVEHPQLATSLSQIVDQLAIMGI